MPSQLAAVHLSFSVFKKKSKIHYIVRYDNVHLKAGWENQVSLTEAR